MNFRYLCYASKTQAKAYVTKDFLKDIFDKNHDRFYQENVKIASVMVTG